MKFFIILTIVIAIYLREAATCGGGGGSGGSSSKTWVGKCWDTWSRCSTWSYWGNGILWKNCNDRCIHDLKKSGGSCKLSPSNCPLSSKAYQCQCY